VIGSQQFQEGFTFDGALGTYTDVGVLDTHTATVDWGDGSDPQDLGTVESGFETGHLYDKPGLYTVILEVEDDDGGTGRTSFTVEVVDTIPPEVQTDTTIDTLWSPNHVMTDVGFSYLVEDLCDPEPSIVVKVYTDEPEDGSPPKAPDVEMDDAFDMTFRAEREGKGDGRVYLIVVTGTDASGNGAFATATVVVTHGQSQKAKDDVEAQAAAAVLHVESNDGAIPAGFTEIGEYVIQ